MRHSNHCQLIVLPLAIAALGLSAAALAQTATESPSNSAMARSARHDARDARDAQDRVNLAVKVVDEMKQDPHLARLLERAHGVFVIPRFGRGAFIVGGEGGSGVVLARHGAKWSDPAFFAVGGASIGAQAGGSGGAVAMLLMTPRALERFETSTGRWSLRAGGNLTVVNYSEALHEKGTARGDVIVWSNQKGLYGGLTASATNVTPESRFDHAYYQQEVGPRDILTGSASNSNADPLRDALLTHVASK